MSEKFADKIKQRIDGLRKEQEQESGKKTERKIELFRETKDEDTPKSAKH